MYRIATVGNTEPITKGTVEIPIILNGVKLNLVKSVTGWSLKTKNKESILA